MKTTVNKLKKHASATPSLWREEAKHRRENKTWLRYSQHIATLMLDKMSELDLTQQDIADRMDVSQQYVSKVLKGRENLSLETLAKIEEALHIGVLVSEYA
jgi:transcriptional regulator with XRE-family HTH domain